ncbi:hypothetical protein SH661x_001799 [Planctomicrobium sp. SH661]|uniref:hypothetical protein n=1 Tax=Planctomicrobium sp. SH661 TaxID=3448124 RepID=UPI003F5B4403
MNFAASLTPIFDHHHIPHSDRSALVRYFNRPNGIPQNLRAYFLSRKYHRFVRECLVAMTRQFVKELNGTA